jgi:hypothetical protein
VIKGLVLCLLLATLLIGEGGCAPAPKKPQVPPQTNDTAAEVQQALMGFADRFVPALAEACDYVEQHAQSPQAAAAARGRKIGSSMAALKNAVNPYPYAGLLDMVVMVTLLDDVAQAPATTQLYGDYGGHVREMMAAQKADIWATAARFMDEAQLQELRQSIKNWRDAHSDMSYVAFVRITDFPETRQLKTDTGDNRPGSVFGLLFLDPLSNLDPAVREVERSRQLAERAFFYLQRMPIIIGWQTDEIYNGMLATPEVQSAINSTATVAGATTRFADIGQHVADTAESLRTDLPKLRDNTVEKMEGAVARQRDAAIQQATTQISAQRDAAVEQVEGAVARQRDAAIRQATTQISAERDAAIRQLTTAFHGETREMAIDLDHVLSVAIDRLFARCLALIACGLLAMLLYRVIAPRLPGGSPSARVVSATTHESSSPSPSSPTPSARPRRDAAADVRDSPTPV